MARSIVPDLYSEVRPAGLLPLLAPTLRRLKVLLYLTIALFIVAVVGAFLPLGTWLLLSCGIAAPTLASALLVASD